LVAGSFIFFTWVLAVLLYLAFDGIPTLQRDINAYIAGGNGTAFCQQNGYDSFSCQGGNLERCYCYGNTDPLHITNKDGKWGLTK